MINNYILGLFATDGNLQEYKWKTKDKTSYTEKLEMKDLDIIEKISNYFKHKVISRTRTINNKEHTFYSVKINTKETNNYATYLKNNKENLYEYFVNLTAKEQNQFVLGAFDGDGGICESKSHGYKTVQCYFSANTKDGLEKIYEHWFNKNNIKYSKYYDKRGKGAYFFNITKKEEIKKMANLFYPSKIYLERKYKKFVDLGMYIKR